MNFPSATRDVCRGGRSASQLSATVAVALQLKNTHTCYVSEFQFGGEFVWRPTPELIAQSNLQQFIEKHGLGSYDELMRRSTTDIGWFWDTVLRDLDVQFYKPYSQIVDLSDGKPWAHWCVDGEMNIVHNMIDIYAGTSTDERIAIKSEIEDGMARTLTYKELREEVNKMAAAPNPEKSGKKIPPILIMASIATTISGTIGMKTPMASPLPRPRLRSATAILFTSPRSSL